MDQLAAMRLFVRVADRGSFSAVAREMGGAQSQVSRQVAQLERALGVHLLQRTTRAVLLTDEGRLYLEFARRAIAEADEGAALVRAGAQQVHGRLRMALPLAVFRHLLFEPLQALMQAHPALQLELQFADDLGDLTRDGVDLALHAGVLSDSTLIARRLTDLPRVVVAAPAYLAEQADLKPEILAPGALAHHECLTGSHARDRRWTFQAPDDSAIAVDVAGRWTFGQNDLLRDAVLRGLGVARVGRYLVDDALRDGRLVRLLPAFALAPLPLHAVYPASRRQVARVEAIVQHLVRHFEAPTETA